MSSKPDARASASAVPLAARSIVHVIAAEPVGGAESVVRLLAGAQRARGSRVTVVTIETSDAGETAFADALKQTSVEVVRLRLPGRAYLRERREIAAVCADVSATVLHSHGYRTDVADAPFVGRRGLPIVSTVHGFTGGNLRSRLYQWLQRRAYHTFDAVVAVSAPLERELAQALGTERLHLQPNAYRAPHDASSRADARAALALPADSFVIGWVGRLSHEKGADVLLDALACADLSDHVQVAFLGDGPEAQALRERAMRLGLGARVMWKGRIARAERLFAAFDTLVLSSRTEGTPMVILEAMAAGVPIVATRVGGVPEVLTAGTAVLVPPESPAELATAIRAMVTNAAAAMARARAAQDRVEREYGVPGWVARYETIYQRAAEHAARRVQR